MFPNEHPTVDPHLYSGAVDSLGTEDILSYLEHEVQHMPQNPEEYQAAILFNSEETKIYAQVDLSDPIKSITRIVAPGQLGTT